MLNSEAIHGSHVDGLERDNIELTTSTYCAFTPGLPILLLMQTQTRRDTKILSLGICGAVSDAYPAESEL